MGRNAVNSVPPAVSEPLFNNKLSVEGAALGTIQLTPKSTLSPPSWFYPSSESFGDYGDKVDFELAPFSSSASPRSTGGVGEETQ